MRGTQWFHTAQRELLTALQDNQKSPLGDGRINQGSSNVSYRTANTSSHLTLCSKKPWLEKKSLGTGKPKPRSMAPAQRIEVIWWPSWSLKRTKIKCKAFNPPEIKVLIRNLLLLPKTKGSGFQQQGEGWEPICAAALAAFNRITF